MKKNMAGADRIIRILFAVLIAVLYFTGSINGFAAIILGLFAVIFIVTSFVGFCPLYSALKISTLKKQISK